MKVFIGLIKVFAAIVVAIIGLNVTSASPLQYQYYLLNPALSTGDLFVQSLSENNKITAGSTELVLDQYAVGKISVGADLTQGAVITGTGPFTLGGEVDATDLPVPGIFAGTAFVIPHYRDNHTYYLLSPYSDAQVTVTIAGVDMPVALTKGQVFTFDAGSDNTLSGIVRSNRPILVSHVAGTYEFMDAYPVAPASVEAWGVHSSNTVIGALEDNTTVTVYATDNKSARNNESVTYILNAGERQLVSFAASKGKTPDISQGQGNALHVVSDKPVATIQIDDADGLEATAFFDTPYLGVHYGIPIDSQYVVVVCTQANTTVTLNDGVNPPVIQECTSDGIYGSKIYFGVPDNGISFSAGAYIESSRPVFTAYEAALQNDEHNVMGHKDSYFILDPLMQMKKVYVKSLVDNNHIFAPDIDLLLHDYRTGLSNTEYGATLFGQHVTPGKEIIGTGPFLLHQSDYYDRSVDVADLPNPNVFAGTDFVIPHYRGTHTYYLLSPYGDAQVTVTIGGVETPVALVKGQVATFDAGFYNTQSGIVQSDRPVLVAHVASDSSSTGIYPSMDAYPVPPASLEAWGVRSLHAVVGALEDNTTVTVYASDSQSSSYVLNTGDRQEIVLGADASQGEGVALHVVADKPIAAIQVDDSDGEEATAFFDTPYLAKWYQAGIVQYVAVVCTEENTTVTIVNWSKPPVVQTCTSDGIYPGKVYFRIRETEEFNGGVRVIADKPVYVIYEEPFTEGERNLLGFNPPSVRHPSPVLFSTSSIVSESGFAITGLAQPNAIVNLYVNGVIVGSVTVDIAGVYSTTVALSEGNNKIYATEKRVATEADRVTESYPSNAVEVSYIPTGRVEYYFVDPQTALSAFTIVSMTKGNQIFVGDKQYTLDSLQSVDIPARTLKRGDVVWGLGAFAVANDTDATDTPTPAALLGQEFVIPHKRNEHKYYIYSPEGGATVTITIGAGLPEQITVPANEVVMFDAGNVNNVAGILISDRPIAVTHQGHVGGTSLRDVYAVPPAAMELWGVKSVNASLAAAQDNTTVTVYSSDLTQATYILNKGDFQAVAIGDSTGGGAGSALHVVADKPVAAIQTADRDGVESTAFWPAVYHGTDYVLPVDTQYVAIACDQPNIVVTLTDSVTSNVTQFTCNATGEHPGKAYFGSILNGVNINARSTIISDKPVYLYYEAAASDDEHNLYGFKLTPAAGTALTLNSAVSPTNLNPYEISGVSDERYAAIDVYVQGVVQQQISTKSDGTFSAKVYLNDGLNDIYVTKGDGIGSSNLSNTIQVQYDNVIDRNNLPTNITADTVWTAGSTQEPYIISSTLTVAAGASLIIEPGVKLHFDSVAGLQIDGSLIVKGTAEQPVYFTSSNTVNPSTQLWLGIVVNTDATISLNNAVIEYADIGIDFLSGSNGSISNSIIRHNTTGIEINGASSPTITTNNIVTQNSFGISLLSTGVINPVPVISDNQIYSNSTYNLNVNAFAGGDSTIVDVRGNYWGSSDPIVIASTMPPKSTSYPTIDFSDYLPGTGGGTASPYVLQTCPIVRVTDDSGFIDIHPEENIAWVGSSYTDVKEIEKAFNNARSIDHSVFQYLQMPTQADWDAMSLQQQGLYLVNSERQARGIKPYEGISQSVVDIVQTYTDFILINNRPLGHYEDGKTPLQRLDEDLLILENRDASINPENGYEIHGSIPVPPDTESLTRAIYNWIYYDQFPLFNAPSWGHRDSILQTGLLENSGETYKEGLIGFGVSSGEYNPELKSPADNGAIVFINAFDPSATWDHSTTQTVNTDAAQLCTNVVIAIDETSVLSVDQIKSIEISPSDIILTPGGTAQLQVWATYNGALSPQNITSAASFVADDLSVININAGYITALRNGDVFAVASVNGVTSNRVLISVRTQADTSNLIGTDAESYIGYVPDNASIDHYDPKALSVYTGFVTDKSGAPLSDVTVSIHNQSKYGSVQTGINGQFSMAAAAGAKRLVYRKSGYLTIHRSTMGGSNAWAVADDVIMLPVDNKETPINLGLAKAQMHKSTPVIDQFGSRSTTLVFNGITSATVTSSDGHQRILSELSVRATEYELPQSMPADLPKESAFTYCSELEVVGVRDDETVTFDNPVVMYVDNFLNFNVGEIVPIGYYDRQIGDWVASDNGIVVKLLDTNNDGLVDGLDINNDNIADDLNQNGSTVDEVVGIENYTVGATYWRGSFDHFTPVDYNWPFAIAGDANAPGDFTAETSNENKEQTELECTGSYVKPETQAFHEDIPVTGTNLTLHYSSQRTEGYKHKLNVSVSGDSISPSMLQMIAKLEIGGNVFEQVFTPAANKEAEFIWDGNDPTGTRVKGIANGLISIGYKYGADYSSAGVATTPAELASAATAWAQVGSNTTNVDGRDEFISWNSSPIAVQNTFDNQLADGWSLSNHHQVSPIGNIYKGDGEVVNIEKTSLVLKTGVKVSRHVGDDGHYQKGGSDIDYTITSQNTLIDKVTGLEWQYIDRPEKFINKTDAINYCSAATFTTDATGWRLPTSKEVGYTIDKSLATQNNPIYQTDALTYWKKLTSNADGRSIPVICVRGEELDTRYVVDLQRDDVNEVVLDSQNGLMWQDDASTTSVKLNWTGSIDHCESSVHAGYDNWRLPNINELLYTLPNTTFVNQTVLPVDAWWPTVEYRQPYWSSTPNLGRTNAIWAVESAGYNWDGFSDTDLFNVRCVRDNLQSVRSPYRFDDLGRHVKTVDLNSGLTLTTFGYDVNNLLITMTDRFGDVVTIARDPFSGKALSITTQDGYVTSLTIDANNDLKQVDYADTTNYQFAYSDTQSSLLTSKTDPNGHVYLHQFNPVDGRTIQTSDQEGGVWDFFSTRQGNSSALYGYNTAELNTYQTLRTILPNGDVNKVTTLFDGTELTNLHQADDLKETLQSCAVTTVVDKVIDSKTKEPVPSKITITQPSLLQSVTQMTKTYGQNDDGVDTTKQKLTVNLNGKISSVVTDTIAGTTVSTSAENRVTTLNVDPATLLLQSSQTPGLVDTSYTYDARGRQKTIVTGTRTTTYTYDPISKGDVTTITADDGKQTHFTYDALGRVKTVTYPDTHKTENIYDDNGNMTTLVVPTPANHGFTYTGVDKVKTETTPKDGVVTEVTQYDYDTERNLKQITLPSSKIITNTYSKGLIDFTTTPEGVIDYAYTCNEKVESITEGTEIITYGYDGSLLKDITYAGALNNIISQTYDNDFNLDSLNYAGSTTGYGYDNDGLLISTTTGTNVYSITRNALNGLPEALGNGTLQQTRGFNGYGEAEAVSTKVNNLGTYDYTLGYNDLGKINTKQETLDDGTINNYVYIYDDRRRLDTVTKNGVLVEDYGYDANGNRNMQANTARGITAQSASYNLGDQLQSNGATSYAYDSDGYLSTKTTGTDVTSYTYSSQGRLLQVTTPSKTISYQHNAIGNRVAKLVDGVVVEKYLWLDKTTLIATYDATDTLLQRFEYTDGNTPTSFTQSGQRYYIVTDHLGSPRTITSSGGLIVKKLDYDSFGNVISDSNTGFNIPFGFAGGLFDKDTGLVRFGFRDYDPDVGRWTARDPIGFGGGDTNLYGYVINNPVNLIDPTGEIGIVGALIGGGIELGVQLATNGFDFGAVNYIDVFTMAAIGAVAPSALLGGKEILGSIKAAKTLGKQLDKVKAASRKDKLNRRIDKHKKNIKDHIKIQGGIAATKYLLKKYSDQLYPESGTCN